MTLSVLDYEIELIKALSLDQLGDFDLEGAQQYTREEAERIEQCSVLVQDMALLLLLNHMVCCFSRHEEGCDVVYYQVHCDQHQESTEECDFEQFTLVDAGGWAACLAASV